MCAARKVSAIIERQAKYWELQRLMAEQGGEAARRSLAHLSEGPWLSVSRQVGSGASTLVAALADRLGWQVFDQEILREISRNTMTHEAVLAPFDGRAVDGFRDYVGQLLAPDLPAQAEFMRGLTEVVWGLARRGRAIIIGRGANWFLDARFGVRLRVVAPLARRIERLVATQDVTPAAARHRLETLDTERREFARQAFGREIDDPTGYDLVLNTSSFDEATALELIAGAIQHKLGNG